MFTGSTEAGSQEGLKGQTTENGFDSKSSLQRGNMIEFVLSTAIWQENQIEYNQLLPNHVQSTVPMAPSFRPGQVSVLAAPLSERNKASRWLAREPHSTPRPEPSFVRVPSPASASSSHLGGT